MDQNKSMHIGFTVVRVNITLTETGISHRGEVQEGYLKDLELGWMIFKVENWLRMGRNYDTMALNYGPSGAGIYHLGINLF